MKLWTINDNEFAKCNAHIKQNVVSCSRADPGRIVCEVGASNPSISAFRQQQSRKSISPFIQRSHALFVRADGDPKVSIQPVSEVCDALCSHIHEIVKVLDGFLPAHQALFHLAWRIIEWIAAQRVVQPQLS